MKIYYSSMNREGLLLLMFYFSYGLFFSVGGSIFTKGIMLKLVHLGS